MKTECDYLNSWIKKRSHTQKSHPPKMVNPRDIAGECRRRRIEKGASDRHYYTWVLCTDSQCNVSTQNGIAALWQANIPSAHLSAAFETLPLKQYQCLSSWTQIVPEFEAWTSATFFLHSSFVQVINAVMLWSVHTEKVPQVSEHLCPAKLQTSCDVWCVSSLSFCSFPHTPAFFFFFWWHSPAISLGFTTLGEIFAYVLVFLIQPLR